MTDLFAEFEGCGAVLVVVGDVLCRDGGFGFRLGGLDARFADLEFVRIQDNLVFKRIQFLQTTPELGLWGWGRGVRDGDFAGEGELLQVKVVERNIVVSRLDEVGQIVCHD